MSGPKVPTDPQMSGDVRAFLEDQADQLQTLTSVQCTNDPRVTQHGQHADWDTLTFTGTGTWKGRGGASIEATLVDAGHVLRALREQVYRADLVAGKIRELVQQGTLLINLSGRSTGQINALIPTIGTGSAGAIRSAPRPLSSRLPCRISARTRSRRWWTRYARVG